MSGLQRHHALQDFERGKRAVGVLGLAVELFVRDGFLRLGYVGPRLQDLGSLSTSSAECRKHSPPQRAS